MLKSVNHDVSKRVLSPQTSGQAAPIEVDPFIKRCQARVAAKYQARIKSLAQIDDNIVKAARLPGVCRLTINSWISRHGIT